MLWLLVLVDWLLPWALTSWGIEARSWSGLVPGVVVAPLLHVGAGHLVSNMVPLVLMGVVAALRDWRGFVVASGVIVVLSGLGVWLIAPSATVTVGASGVVFGYFGYLVGRGVFVRQFGDIALSVVVVVVYGSLVWGVFPQEAHVSWQAHLCGLLAGLLAAFGLARRERALVARARVERSGF
ncbi:rhomboid family intramembrane serine protease [Natronoglycomyces albus]|uniref:Rhomboid family intramembrane serine protease n=1 Tax=Natronoglycomyces albus TaxID=2811108 RepID=A0A895XU55_9ACTN|nr:rhomboid family intramembrane serine protease [Natronoglycomyces albus]QSB06829.1 rhomboid family intramembrane serine protease [Natronoglycomyces albus]